MAETSTRSLSEFDDPEVVGKLAVGDEGAQDRLFERAVPALAELVRRTFGNKVFTPEESYEIASDAVMKARETILNFKPEEEGTFSGWLVTIAFNKARDRIRWRKSSNRDPLERPDTVFIDNPVSIVSTASGTATPQPSNEMAGGTELFSKEQVKRLQSAAEGLPAAVSKEIMRRALADKLSEQERYVLISRMEGLSDKQIASILGIKKDYVKVIRNRALSKWAEALEKAGTDER